MLVNDHTHTHALALAQALTHALTPDADGVDGEQACKSPSMGGDVYSFKQLKEQKLASPLQAPAAGKHKAPSMIDLLGKVEHTLILAHAHEPFTERARKLCMYISCRHAWYTQACTLYTHASM
jgi:hypothetical protein